MSARFTNLPRVAFQRLLRLITFRSSTYARSIPGGGSSRSVFIRHVDCGSCNAVEQEIAALFNPVYDLERFGFQLVASPRHADILLLSGPLTRNMRAALLATFDAMPEPRSVVTIGDGFDPDSAYAGSYAVVPLPDEILAVRLAHVPGDPPTPQQIVETLLKLRPGGQ